MSIYRRVLRYYRPYLAPNHFGLVLSLGGIGLNLLKPWPFKIIVDQIIPDVHKEPNQPHHSFTPSICSATNRRTLFGARLVAAALPRARRHSTSLGPAQSGERLTFS